MRLPWFRGMSSSDPISQLHRLVFCWQWEMLSGLRKKATFVLAMILWPAKSVVLAGKYVVTHGSTIAQEFSISKWKQWIHMVALANAYNITPETYYNYRLFEAANRKKAGLFIQHHEIIVLLSVLNQGTDTDVVDNKGRFFEMCRAHDIPTASVVAIFEPNNKDTWYETEPGVLPACSLFLKWANLYCGVGAEAWMYEEHNRTWRRGDEVVDREGLINRCRNRATESPLILQERLGNPKETAKFSTDALCTLRVVTCRSPDQRPRVLTMTFRMPTGKSDVDNFTAGGIAAGVDPETGTLGTAIAKGIRGGLLYNHPDTGTEIAGQRLFGWQEMKELCVRAHDAFRVPWSVGWDVAMTPSGPVMLEGNTIWGINLVQIGLDRPIGETVFPTAFLEALARKKKTQGEIN